VSAALSNHDDNELFLSLLTGSQRVLHAFILKLVPSLADADDILQETNLVLWSKRAEFQPGSDFRGWAFTIARYQVMAFRKRRSLDRLTFGEKLLEQLAALAPARSDIFEEKRLLLIDCLRRLTDAQRELLDDYYKERLSGRQIAEKTGRTVDAVFQALHRTRAALLDCIEHGLAENKNAEDD